VHTWNIISFFLNFFTISHNLIVSISLRKFQGFRKVNLSEECRATISIGIRQKPFEDILTAWIKHFFFRETSTCWKNVFFPLCFFFEFQCPMTTRLYLLPLSMNKTFFCGIIFLQMSCTVHKIFLFSLRFVYRWKRFSLVSFFLR